MKFSSTSSLCLLFAAAAASTSVVDAFLAPTRNAVGHSHGVSSSTTTTTTTLHISSWGKGKSASNDDNEQNMKSPRDDIQSYLEGPPTKVEIKSDGLDSTCIVSGWEGTGSQQVLYNLNNEDSYFKFKKIQVVTPDIVKAKKQLLSREARYTGLYDKLDYMEVVPSESESGGELLLPTSDQLSSSDESIQSWVAIVDDSSTISKIVDLCKTSSSNNIKNLSILLVNQDLSEDFTSILNELKSLSEVKSSLIVVGELYDDIVQAGTVNLPSPCTYREIITTSDEKKTSDDEEEEVATTASTKFSKTEGMKMVTECLQLQSSVGKGFVLSEISDDSNDDNNLDVKLIKGLREAGYDRTQEVDYMLRYGTTTYKEAINKYEEINPKMKTNAKNMVGDPIKTTNAWWEDKEFQKNVGILPKDDDDNESSSEDEESGGGKEVAASIAEEESTTA